MTDLFHKGINYSKYKFVDELDLLAGLAFAPRLHLPVVFTKNLARTYDMKGLMGWISGPLSDCYSHCQIDFFDENSKLRRSYPFLCLMHKSMQPVDRVIAAHELLIEGCSKEEIRKAIQCMEAL